MLYTGRCWIERLPRMDTWSHVCLATILVICSCIGGARAQDPAKVAPSMYKVLFENDDARVIEVTGKPGDKSARNAHPDHVVYAINPGKVKFTLADGKTKEVSMKAGDVLWSAAETHESLLVEGKDFKVVVIELKKAPAAGAKPSKVADADDQAKSAADITKVLLDNDRVRVLETNLKPGGKLPKHAHPAHVVYAFTPAKVKFTNFPDQKTTEKSMEAGQAFAIGPVTHTVENVGTTDAHSLLVEIK